MDISPAAIRLALVRARGPIVWIGITYALSVAAGATLVHLGNPFALRQRDELVGAATRSSPITASLQTGHRVRAAMLDAAGNLCLGAVPSTIMGLGVVFPFPWAAYRGWIGGIVSVDGSHASRLGDWHEGLYYLSVLILQLIPYSLAGGAGVRLGLAFVIPKGRYGFPASARWWGLPEEAVRDVARIYLLAAPLFLLASLVEFLLR